jgi:NADH-quinone oxidoreductase subunit F
MTGRIEVRVGLATCGIAAGAEPVLELLRAEVDARGLNVVVKPVGCLGMCYNEPLVEVVEREGASTLYRRLDEAAVVRIVEEHLVGGTPVDELAVGDDPFFRDQVRIVLENCGVIDPESLDEYRARGGYDALQRALTEMSPEGVIEAIAASGLRGRGGGGFPTGKKWSLAAAESAPIKYMICNADEGDPGAFMDRSVLEGDPHRVLEGMAIAAYAIGASRGYVYVRAEYPLAIRRLDKAIAAARRAGLLGERLLDSPFSFDVAIKEGAGAFVCGEETALIASIEGRRGAPRRRPPYPSESGLMGRPTVINNVETLANVPWILRHGADRFAGYGTEGSKGTKVFALAGKIERSGLIEISMGMPIGDIVHKIGGGVRGGKRLKAVQMGGPSGGCIPASLADVPVDYESLKATGAIVGSGGMIVLDEDTCMVDVARFFLDFTQKESCGKCTFCRIGTKRMLEMLDRFRRGEGDLEDIDRLIELGEMVKAHSLCGLGQTAPNPVLTTTRYFREEYEAHIRDGECRARVCRDLITFRIDAETCRDCKLCVPQCPVGAITQGAGAYQVIDEETCVRCGRCRDVCPFSAIDVVTGKVRA